MNREDMRHLVKEVAEKAKLKHETCEAATCVLPKVRPTRAELKRRMCDVATRILPEDIPEDVYIGAEIGGAALFLIKALRGMSGPLQCPNLQSRLEDLVFTILEAARYRKTMEK